MGGSGAISMDLQARRHVNAQCPVVLIDNPKSFIHDLMVISQVTEIFPHPLILMGSMLHKLGNEYADFIYIVVMNRSFLLSQGLLDTVS